MKKLLLSFIVLFLFAATVKAQNVLVSGAVVGNGLYPDLGSAFTAINGGNQASAAIVVGIIGNTAEGASAILNAGTWTSLTISPSGGATRTITGAIAGNLIDLNGADNVTINGLNTGGDALIISNTATGASNTIRFIGDATNNTITNCTIQGSASTASNAVVFFSTGTTTGNDENNINNCNITAAGSNLPINAIYSLGTSAVIDNSGNTLNANNISDYFNAAAVSIGINLANTGNSTWTITNNKLFQTATRIYTTAQTHNGIFIGVGAGYTITGNIIGFANTSGTGTTNIVGNSVALTGTFPSAYTTTGTANATRYIAINCAFTAAGTVSSIQNNTIAGFALYTSSGAATTNGIFCGINITSGNANIGTTTGNIIGAATGTGSIYTACTSSGGMVAGIYATTVNTINIQNNTIGAIDAMGTTASISGGIHAINSAGTGGTFNISGNTVGNATNPNFRTGNLTTGANLSNTGTTHGLASGIGTFRGIYNQATGTVTIGTASLPNTIRNAKVNTSSSGALTSVFRGIDHSGAATVLTISNNTITNLSTASSSVSFTDGGITGVGIYLGTTAGTNTVISDNTISSLSLTNAGTGGYNLAGISYTAPATSITITRNKIYDLFNASTSVSATAPGTVSGIFIRNSIVSVPNNINNNMISLGNGQTTNTAFIGIWAQWSSSAAGLVNVYYNTINIEGTATSGAQPSFCFYRGDFSVTALTTYVLDIRNNIFNNTRTGGTGKHYAISNSYGAAASSATGWSVSNNNLLNAAIGTIGYWSGDKNFSGWKGASANDANSVSGYPVTFVNSANDLHLNMSITPTPIESGGVVITGVTTDYDNQTRPGGGGVTNGGGTVPDIGADEFDGVFLDVVGPTISYTALVNNSLTISHAVTGFAITDINNVNTTSGTKPRLYYKRSTDGNTYNDNTSGTDGWKYVEANGSSSPFDFTIDYSKLNGGTNVIIGQIVQYFVVAEDLAPVVNVGINSGVFTAAPSTVALTNAAFPITGTINQYTIVAAFAGSYNVGPGQTYTSFTAAGGLFAAINGGSVSGNITANVTGDITIEDGVNALNQAAEEGLGNYTFTIQPSGGAARTVSGSNTTVLFGLNGADRVTINGLNSGGNSLTIRNTSVTTGAVVRFLNDATNNTITNCTIEGQNSSTTSALIFFSTSTGSVGNSNNTISNSTIRDRTDVTGVNANAFYSSGTASALNTSNSITGNTIINFSSNGVSLTATGIGNGWTISNNNFYNNLATPPATAQNGILIAGGTGHTVSSNFIGGNAAGATGTWTNTGNVVVQGISITGGVASITGNTIANITTNNVGTTLRLRGIALTTANDNNTINNNNIYNLLSSGAITSYAAGSQPVTGIYVFTGSTFYLTTISGNEIYNISAENTTALTVTNIACGMFLTNFSGQLFKNRIYDIKNKSTGITAGQPPIAAGIYTRFLDDAYLYNNIITVGDNETTNTQFNAFLVVSGTEPNTINLYNNTLRIAGTAGGTWSSSVIQRGDNTTTTPLPTITINNNIVLMERSGGGSVNYLYANQGTSASSFWNSNNNLLHNAGNISSVAYWDASAHDFSSLKSVLGKDQFSVSFDPVLSSLVPTVTTGLAGIGIAGLTTDYAGTTRNVPPSMGAYEVSITGSWKMAAGSTDWSTNTNWVGDAGPGTMPMIPLGASLMPTLSTTASIARLNNYGTLTIDGSNTLQVSENIINGGTINGTAASLILNGTAAQAVALTGNINVKDFTLGNAAGATLSGTGKLNVTGTVSFANVNSSTLATGGRLVLKSSASGTARIADVTNAGVNTGNSVTGGTTIERYIGGGRRGYRFLAHPFSAAMALTQLADDIDITGNASDAASPGFTATTTNNPSAYSYNPATGDGSPTNDIGWTAYTTAAGTVPAGTGFRILIRGTKGQTGTLTGANPSPDPVTLSDSGAISNTAANVTKTLTYTVAMPSYNLVGNPYASAVNLKTVTPGAGVNNNYWIWNVHQGSRGGYITYAFGVNDYSLPSSASFFGQAIAGVANTYDFHEVDKTATDTSTMLRTNGTKRNILEMSVSSNNVFYDRYMLQLDSKGSANKDTRWDAAKMQNAEVNLYSLSKDNKQLAIDVRPFEEGAIIPLGFTNDVARVYTLSFPTYELEDNVGMYLHDKYLSTYTKLKEGVSYPFSTSSDAATQGDNRFELVMKQAPVLVPIAASFSIKLSPNPATDIVKVSFSNEEKAFTTITIVNAEGKTVRTVDAGNVESGIVSINVKGLAKGSYYVTLNNGKQKRIEKLQVQ